MTSGTPQARRLSAVLVLAAVMCVEARSEQAAPMHIRLKSVQFDPLATQQPAAPPGWDRWIVQVARPLTREDLARLQREYGLGLQRYVPEGAYLERADEGLVARLRQDPLVRWVGPYLPGYKMDPAVARRRLAEPTRDITVLVEGFADLSGDGLRAAVHRAGFAAAEILRVPAGGVPRVRVVIPPSADLGSLTRLHEVSFIELPARIDIDHRS